MRKTLDIMGTVASIDIPECADILVFEKCYLLLKSIEQDFSPYINSNLLARYNHALRRPTTGVLSRRELKYVEAIANQCSNYKSRTLGSFDPFFDGQSFNPTGYIKGWAIARVGRLLKKLNHHTFYITIGGDTLVASNSAKTWKIGISDPLDTSKIIKVIALKNGEIATSGSYERPGHLYDPSTNRSLDRTRTVTVIGKSIITADVFATALCVPNSKTVLPKNYRALLY
jgi:FAD:protein FMN transferase